MIRRNFGAVLLVLLGTFNTGCKENRDDMNRRLISAGIPHISDPESKQVHFGGRHHLVYFGNDQSEAADGYRNACCSKERMEAFDPLAALSVEQSGLYLTKITKGVYLLTGVPFDGIDIRELTFNVYAKCSEQHFVFTTLNHDELPTLYSKPMALCHATAP